MHKYILTGIGYFLFLLCSFNVLPAETGTEKTEESHLAGNYAINLASSLDPFTSNNVPPHAVFDDYRLYTSRFSKDGQLWYRLRVGFFPTSTAAEHIHKDLASQYPGAWIPTVTDAEKDQSAGTTI